MKIKSDLSYNFFTIYGDAKGIARSKKRILKTKGKIYINYYLELIIKLIAILTIVYYYIFNNNPLISLIAFTFLIILVSIYIVRLFSIFMVYEQKYKSNFMTSITIDERGILDESFYGIKMLFKWNKIVAVIVGKHSIVILTDTPIYFFFSKRDSKKIIKTIERYHKNIMIIE